MDKQEFTFDLLPDDIWLCIISHVHHFEDRGRLCQVSRSLNRLVIDFYRRLKTISFDSYKSRSFELEDLEPLLKRVPNLREANFSNQNKMSIIRIIKPNNHRLITDNCRNLLSLNLTRVQLAPSELLSIATKCDRITTLILNYVKLDDELELSHVMDVCRARLLHLKMQNISIYRPGFTNDSYIKATGSYCLQSLDIASAMLFDATNFVQSCPNLEHLSIQFKGKANDSGLEDYAFDEISEIIQRCPKLKLLNGICPSFAALPENIHLLFVCGDDDHDAIYDDYSDEEIDKIERLATTFDYCRQRMMKEYQQECVSVTYGPVDGGRRTFDYAKINRKSMDPLFVRNVLPGDQIYLSRKKRRLLVQGIVLSDADFYDDEDYDESFMYIVFNNSGERFTSSMFSTNMDVDDFKVFNIDLRSALASRSPKSCDEQRVLSDSFLCDILLTSRYFISNDDHRNLVRYVQLSEDSTSITLNNTQKSIIQHAISHRITTISKHSLGEDNESLIVASLANHLFETRCHKDSKILICAASDRVLDISADKIHKMGKLDIVSIRPKYDASGDRKPFYLDQRLRELPMTFPGIQSNFITTLQYFQLNEQTRRNWILYQSDCANKIVERSQVLCCTYNNVARLIVHEDWIKVDSVIIIDSHDHPVVLPEIRLIIQHLPRRIILIGDEDLPRIVEENEIGGSDINCADMSLFDKLKTIGLEPIKRDINSYVSNIT